MNPPTAETGSQILTLLASLMLVLQLLLAVQTMLVTNIRIFALQSLLLAAIAGVVGYTYHAWHVYVITVLTIIGKVLFLPWRLERLVRQIKSLERLGSNTLAIAIALLLTGFFLMINRRKAITQVLALLTMENGVMVAAIALTTYGMPLVVEIGIFFDV